MKRGAATIAIVTTRLRKESRIIALVSAAFGLLAYLQRYDDAAAQLAGVLVFGTLTGIAISLLQRAAGRYRELELCEQSAPLYGRELARATALVPCIVVTAGVAAYWIVASIYTHVPALSVLLAAFASIAATLVAMCAVVRTGFSRLLYVVMACSISAAAFLLTRWPLEFALLFCTGAGFIALRQYGEALARYDPI